MITFAVPFYKGADYLDRAVRSAVYKDQRFSDHAPLTVDYDYPHRR